MSLYPQTNPVDVDLQARMVTDIKSVITEAQDLLSATADQAGDNFSQLRERIQTRLADAKVRLLDAETMLIAKTKAAARASDGYVHDSPWTAVGIAAGVGLLVGLLIGRR